MRSEVRGSILAVLAFCGALPAASAQVPYTVFDKDTEVRSVRFVFPDTRTFEEVKLERAIGIRGRGALYGIRDALSVIPLVPDPSAHPFALLELQYDVARLRRFYAESGFLETDVRYEVRYQDKDNVVDVDLIIREGRPSWSGPLRWTVRAKPISFRGLPEEMRGGWESLHSSIVADTGQRLTEESRLRHERDLLNWWKNRGWAFATVRTDPIIDSSTAAASVRVTLTPGPRAKIGSISIDGGGVFHPL
jgi:outer membrane protein insertion porin family